MPKVTEAHLEARRQQILDAAWACFARKGYHQTTMQDICQESGLSPGAIYRYFASKEEILKACADRSLERHRELVEAIRAEAQGPMDVVEALAQTVLSMFDDPMFETWTRLDIETRPEFLRNEVLRESARNQLAFWRTVVTQLMAEAKEKGQLKAEVDPEALAILGICLYEGLRQYMLLGPDIFKPAAVYGLVLSLASETSFIQSREHDEARSRAVPTARPSPQRRRQSRKKEAADVRLPP